VKYSHWTTSEIRKLRALHDNGHPTYAQLSEALPRHSINSSVNTARTLGLRNNLGLSVDVLQLRWLRLAHQHFARREAEQSMKGIYGGVR
jgi:hypothetical protein